MDEDELLNLSGDLNGVSDDIPKRCKNIFPVINKESKALDKSFTIY